MAGRVVQAHRDPARIGRNAQRVGRPARCPSPAYRGRARRRAWSLHRADRTSCSCRRATCVAGPDARGRHRCPSSPPPPRGRCSPAPTTAVPERRRCSSPGSRATPCPLRASSAADSAGAAGARAPPRYGARGAGMRCERPPWTNESSSMRSMPSAAASRRTDTAGSVAARPLMIHRSRIRCAPSADEQRLDGGPLLRRARLQRHAPGGCRARADRSRPTTARPPDC